MKLKLQNVGGIVDETSIDLKDGLNVIRAPNATGKTSFTHALKLASMDNRQLSEHPEFINDFTNQAVVEIDGAKRVIENKGLSPMSKTEPLFRMNGRENILFAMPENEFLQSIIKGEPIDKFLESFSDAQYLKQLIERDGVLDTVRDELNDEYGRLNDEATEANSLKVNIEKENKNLIKLQDEKVKTQSKLADMKHQVKMNSEEEGRLSQLQEDIEVFEKEIDETKGNIIAWTKDTQEKELDVAERKTELDRFQKEFKNVDDTLKIKANEIKSLETKLKELYEKLNQLETEITSTEKNIEGNQCLSCGRNFSIKEQKKRLQVLNLSLDALNKEVRTSESDLITFNEEEKTIKQRRNTEMFDNQQKIITLDSSLRKNAENITDAEKVIERRSEELKKKKDAMELVKKNVDPKIKKLLDEEEILSRQVNAIKSTLAKYNVGYDLVSDSQKQVVVIKEKYDFLKRVDAVVKEELANLKNIVRNSFNAKIMKIYNQLGFKDFKNIEIDSTFKIKVNRKGKEQELNRLSTSERVTLGVIVMLVGKEEYLPEYPFFVMDEVTTAYDPVRFKKIIDYLANETSTKYTIVTAFSPTGDKIKVEHQL